MPVVLWHAALAAAADAVANMKTSSYDKQALDRSSAVWLCLNAMLAISICVSLYLFGLLLL